MAKEFNITGTCIPNLHYMADITNKIRETLVLIEKKKYFIINRPRQYGKTTMLSTLRQALNSQDNYLALGISFEGIGDEVFQKEESFTKGFLELLAREAAYSDQPELAGWLETQARTPSNFQGLSKSISEFVEKTGKWVVLLIDEVDKSSNNQLFISFLGMLRNKYLGALDNRDITFYSIVLAGVHDVKTLKLKLRPDEESKYNSPWNIAADFKVDMNLYPAEIVPMLEDYSRERGVRLDTRAIAERLFYYTSGYPFLVSKICKMLDEDLLPGAAEWTLPDIDMAVQQLVKESNTNFDSLIKNLENNSDLYKMVFNLLIEGQRVPFNIHLPVINLGVLYGIFGKNGQLSIHNRVYQEIIYNYMSLKTQTQLPGVDNYTFTNQYVLPGNALNMPKLLLKFQAFMKEQYSKKDRDFLERQGRLVFLAFLKPILNGAGYDFKEPQISEEKRLDIIITFYQHKYLVELKIWRGPAAHQEGLLQLGDYLERQQLPEGFLIIFDHSEIKEWKQEQCAAGEKSIFAVWA